MQFNPVICAEINTFDPEMNKRTTLLRQPAWLICFFVGAVLCLANAEPAPAESSLADMDIGDLMKVPVLITASKIEQKSTEAPSSASVFSSVVFFCFGFRTLAVVL